MANAKVKIQSMVPYRVGITIVEYRIERVFEKEGQIALIDAEAFQTGLYSDGLRSLFEQGILYLPEKADRIEFGFEVKLDDGDDDAAAGVNQPVKIFTTKQMVELLKTASIEDFTKTCDEMSDEQLNLMVNLAVANKLTDYGKVQVLKKKTGKNVMKTVEIMED